ncbi:Clp protease N-terminal domain-containing protein [Kitasatospora sp. NPDC057223]|uniref:Clp protease N-terminal domain-containing protein n=1 Tax=Kitasatospora sp. NPDC057223 TaxID=3346055 RepID=UPI003632D35A
MQLPLSASLRQVLDEARREAQGRGHRQADTGRLLLGLLHEPDGATALALARAGATGPALRAALEARWAAGAAERDRRPFPVPAGESPPLEVDGDEALLRADASARAAGRDAVEAADLLLALFEGRGPGREALHTLDLTTHRARESVARHLAG